MRTRIAAAAAGLSPEPCSPSRPRRRLPRNYLHSGWSNALTDTAGNSAVPGSFTFTTGSGPDTTQNYIGSNFNGLTNVGTNFAPTVNFSKRSTRSISGADGTPEQWSFGTTTAASTLRARLLWLPAGLSATFTPTVPLLPDTYYRLYNAGGYYDVDGNYLNGSNFYFKPVPARYHSADGDLRIAASTQL